MIRPSIQQQTLLLAMLPMLLAIVLLDSYFIYTRFSAMESNMLERASLLSKQIASTGEYALFSGNLDEMQRDISAALKQRDVAAVAVEDAAGKIMVYSGGAIQEAENTLISGHSRTGVIDDTPDYFWLKEPISSQAISINDFAFESEEAAPRVLGYVLVKMSKIGLKQSKWDVLGASVVISLLLVSLTIFFVMRLSRRIVQPIRELNKLVRNIGEGNLDLRLSDISPVRELKELTDGVNEMAAQLQEDRVALDKQTELLRANEERLNEIINTMPVSLFIKDAQSRIILMNSACEAQWGVLFSNVAGTDAHQYFPVAQTTAFLANDRAVMEAHKMMDFEEEVWNSEIKASRIVHTFKKAVYDNNGAPQYLIGISVDISERKMAEKRLRHLNEQLETRIEAATRELRLKKEIAENASYDKTRFLAAASHDLRQPMHALGLFVAELQAKLTTDEQRQLVEKVEESVVALSNLLDALLDISKLDAGVVAPNLTNFPLGNLLQRISHDFASLAESRGISLHLIARQVTVRSDPILLERILINLVSNAIRYTPKGGRVVLACRRSGEKIRIEVRDNGIGIPEAEQKSIFREFIQLANKERDRSKGLGLGLAIVDRIAKLLRHEIRVRSAEKMGAVFSVLVPRAEATEKPVQLPTEIQAVEPYREGLEQLRVLVVDDNPLVRKGMQGIIESWGWQACSVTSFAEFKTQVQKSRFDLVLCDYRLPDGNGIEMADWLGQNVDASPLFILISGDTSPEILQLVRERGIHILHKPVRPAKLRSLIQYLINARTRQ